jgi:isopentenyl diphosphate isomerase/L-lactate dehydrogenase-like FMN-dependent dehydrogenase
MVVLIHTGRVFVMPVAVKKTISLPPELAHAAEEMAQEEGKTLSGVIQDALRAFRAAKMKDDFRAIQGYWSKKAKQKGILTEKDLERLLSR